MNDVGFLQYGFRSLRRDQRRLIMPTNEEISRYLHVEVVGKCPVCQVAVFNDGHKCIPFGHGIPDYCSDDESRSLLAGAVAKVIEMCGLDAYGRALTQIGLQNGVSSDDEHGAFLLTATALQVATAVYNAHKAGVQK